MEKQKRREILLLGTLLIVIYTAVQHADLAWGLALALLKILQPFLFGAGLAFILNVPMRFFETKVFTRMKKTKTLRRSLSLLIVLMLVALVIYLMVALMAPEIRKAVESIIVLMPKAFSKLNQWLLQFDIDLSGYVQSILQTPDQIRNQLDQLLNLALKGAVFSTGVIGAVYSSVLQFFFTVMFMIYFLFAKERLQRQLTRVGYAYLPKKTMDRLLEVGSLTQRTFSSFISGQCLEALILGGAFFLCMTLFRFPYALLISVFIAVTALVPVLGAWIGCIAGALLILMVDPMQALLFVVMFIALQQLEGNLIYPHVMGNAIGLPSLWVLLAVVLGEGLLGIVGMLLFIPLTSVVYTLLRQHVNRRLQARSLEHVGEENGE